MNWRMTFAGPSRDDRTNRWKITPPCGHRSFEPKTTMFRTQYVECPRCGVSAVACYNDRTFNVLPPAPKEGE